MRLLARALEDRKKSRRPGGDPGDDGDGGEDSDEDSEEEDADGGLVAKRKRLRKIAAAEPPTCWVDAGVACEWPLFPYLMVSQLFETCPSPLAL